MASEDHSAHARFIEDAIVRLACSDMPVSPTVEAHFVGYKESVNKVVEELNRYGLDGDDLDMADLTPLRTYLLCPDDSHENMLLSKIERLGFVERLNYVTLMGGDLLPRIRRDTPLCKLSQLAFGNTGKVMAQTPILFHLENNRWHAVNKQYYKPNGKQITVKNRMNGSYFTYNELSSILAPWPELATVSEWGDRMCWGITMRMPSAPGLIVATDPTGVKELLRARDVPDGRTRREALKHWVKDHWRKNRKDESVEHQVREHLRGSNECNWFGLECHINHSKIDEAKANLARLKGKVWRKVGKA